MGYRFFQIYFETPTGYFSVYLIQHAYTREEDIICRYKAEIVLSGDSRESHCIYNGNWKSNLLDALIEGIEKAYEKGALKLLFTKCLEDAQTVAKMFYEG
jgi:argininosuccinate synthase